MRRISTFKMFESAGEQADISKANANIQAAIDELGPLFAPLGWGFEKLIQRKPGSPGQIHSERWVLNGINLAKVEEGDRDPLLRVLICQIIFGLPSEDVDGLGVTYECQDAPGLTFTGFELDFNSAVTGFRITPSVYSKRDPIFLSWPLTADRMAIIGCLRKVMGEVMDNIQKVKALWNEDEWAPGLYDETIRGKMASAIASALLDSGTQASNQFLADTIAKHIRESEGSKAGLVSLIAAHLPRVWRLLKPMLGRGAEETSSLADLGF